MRLPWDNKGLERSRLDLLLSLPAQFFYSIQYEEEKTLRYATYCSPFGLLRGQNMGAGRRYTESGRQSERHSEGK